MATLTQWVWNGSLVSMFVLYVAFGLNSLLSAYHDILPTHARCEAAFNRQVTAKPCAQVNGLQRVGVSNPQYMGHESLANYFVLCFALGAVCAAFAALVSYRSHVKASQDPYNPSNPVSFTDFLEHMVKGKHIHTIQTIAALCSLVVWATATSLSDGIDRMDNLLDPSSSIDEIKTVALWYTCGSNRLLLLAPDLFIQGAIALTLAVWLLAPVKSDSSSNYRLAIVDFLQMSTVIWALTSTIEWPSVRPYNLYLLSGCIRALRIFDGIPDLARHYNMLVGETTLSEVGRFKDPRSVSSQRLLAGQASLAIKIGFFLIGATMLIISVEGWPCQYHISNRSPCECYPEFKTFIGTLYFVFTTFGTVGFGDIVPRTSIGRLVVIGLIATALYLAPTWISQIEKQYTHYRAAKRTEQRFASRPTLTNTNLSRPSLSRRVDSAVDTTERYDEPAQPTAPLSDAPLPSAPALSANDTLVEHSSDPQSAPPPAGLEVPASALESKSPPGFKFKMPSFKIPSFRSKVEDKLYEDVPTLSSEEWTAVLQKLTRQQNQLAQQQALVQLLLKHTLKVCQTDPHKAGKLGELLVVLQSFGT
eukprot:c6584_g1_i2.p1 GENE.c6584_g1_i2~~c6584_g1_i2.p1  ORF type:complete len:589 (+),score=101.85 c6584_g1_i2:83-1849(+)